MIVTRNEAGILIVDLNFLVPIPAGHEVLLVAFRNPRGADFFEASQARCAIDRTVRLVYADCAYWDSFKTQVRTAHPADEPALGAPWRTEREVRGVSLGGVMSSKDEGEVNHAWTRLYVRPPESEPGYRG
jgi:hypothetical protein